MLIKCLLFCRIFRIIPFFFSKQEKRGLRELRVLENLNNTIFEANDKILPKCEEVMHGNLNEILKRCKGKFIFFCI